MHLANLTELHIEDTAVPGFRKFLEKYSDYQGRDLYVQFTEERPIFDKRHAGEFIGHKDIRAKDAELLKSLNESPAVATSTYKPVRGLEGGYNKWSIIRHMPNGRAEPIPGTYGSEGEANAAIKRLKDSEASTKWRYEPPPHSDPIGLYAYPLDYVIKHPYDIAYGAGMQFLRVIRRKPDAKVMRLQRATKEDVQKALEVTGVKMGDVTTDAQVFSDWWDTNRTNEKSSWGFLWWAVIQRSIKQHLNDPDNPQAFTVSKPTEVRPQDVQAKIIRRLGFDAVEDEATSAEDAIIFTDEPEQIVFVNPKGYEPVDAYMLGRKEKDGTKSKGIATGFPNIHTRWREMAEKVARVMNDKVVGEARDLEGFGGRGDDLEPIFNYLNSNGNLAVVLGILSEKRIGDSTNRSNRFFRTKKGYMLLEIVSGGGQNKEGHRSLSTTNKHSIEIQYMDDQGFTKTPRLRNDPIEAIAHQQLLDYHPREKWWNKPVLDHESVHAAAAMSNRIMRWWVETPRRLYDDFAGMRNAAYSFGNKLRTLASIVGTESFDSGDSKQYIEMLGWAHRIMSGHDSSAMSPDMAKQVTKGVADPAIMAHFNRFFASKVSEGQSLTDEPLPRLLQIWNGEKVEPTAEERKMFDILKWAMVLIPNELMSASGPSRLDHAMDLAIQEAERLTRRGVLEQFDPNKHAGEPNDQTGYYVPGKTKRAIAISIVGLTKKRMWREELFPRQNISKTAFSHEWYETNEIWETIRDTHIDYLGDKIPQEWENMDSAEWKTSMLHFLKDMNTAMATTLSRGVCPTTNPSARMFEREMSDYVRDIYNEMKPAIGHDPMFTAELEEFGSLGKKIGEARLTPANMTAPRRPMPQAAAPVAASTVAAPAPS